ncbi:MAG: hypothetical protein HKN23_02800 [Verrucomicrobiales bacterium]|nr:hypothetical protein [Verrucomicrobiales bacterium]
MSDSNGPELFEEDFTPAQPASRDLLRTVLESGNIERLEEEARRCLGEDPEDFYAHYYRSIALLDLGLLKEAKEHIDFLQQTEPEAWQTILASVIYWDYRKNNRKLLLHSLEGIRVEPDMAVFHRYAAIAELGMFHFPQAQAHIDQARALDPEDPDIANLHIRIHSIHESSATDAWKRIHKFEEALKSDPNAAELHHGIGDILLDDLDDPAAAEERFRIAVNLEPKTRLYQKALFQAVAKRSLVYRLFSIPSRTWTWLGYLMTGLRIQPWRIIFLIIGFKLVIGFLLWLLLATVLFYPGCRVYEWLLVSELKRGTDTTVKEMRAWFWFRRWPIWLRFSLFLAANIGIWAGLFALLDIPLKGGLIFVGIFAGIHLVIVSILWLVKRGSSTIARKSTEQERNRPRTTPPPLPPQNG